ncbi:hypothetical protein SBRCBS47491_007862 [Sporothrix bragantina]|uniref:BZIP domain-containing protein n=1 Tax=Sporothrix bragantina TaxID=671064 RepID=A0ABP0CGR1_9PEZI
MSLAVIAREVPRRSPTITYMESDLAILNAAHYDIGVPLPATMRATRGSKRKLQTLLTERDSATDTNMITSTQDKSRALSAMTAEAAAAEKAHTITTEDLLSAVDVSPTVERAKVTAPPSSPPSKIRKAPAKRPAPKVTSNERANIMGSDGDDDDEDDDQGDGAEGDKKRARGRPRIDAKDVTAADRRRTQIRLAQRAYRSRKEKAIVSLEKRVTALKEANEAMSTAFMALHDFAVERGLLDTHPDLAQQLRQTTEVFLEMARQSSADEAMDDNDEEEQQKYQAKDGPLSQSENKATDEAWAFRKKQQAITEAVKTFGYQTTAQHQQQQRQPAAMSKETAIRQAHQIQEQLYGGVIMQQPQPQQQQDTFGQPPALFDNSFGLAMDIMNSVSSVPTSPVVGPPLSSSFFSGSGRDPMASGNDVSSSSNTALSGSPVSGPANNNNDFGSVMGGNPFSFDGPSFSLFPTYPPPSGQDAVPTSTSDLGPHLADTDAFIANASIGSPFGIDLPTHIDIPNISFGLRLRRYALESAYRLINTPEPPSDIFARAFGFCIMFEPVDAIRQRLIRGLETPLTPNKFTRWELPFVTKTPDPDEEPPAASSSSVTSQTTQTSRGSRASLSMGCRSGIPNNSNSDHRGTGVRSVTPRINVTLPGFEGAFYDCEETEMYLQQRGVHIPPNSDSIIVEVDDADFALDDATTVASSASGSGLSATGTTTTSASSTGQSLDGSSAGSSGSRFNNPGNSVGIFDYLSPDLVTSKTAATPSRLGRGNDKGTSGVSAPTQNGLMASFLGNSMFSFDAPLQTASNAGFPQRRLLMLDVEKLLRELVRRGTCLGQTPGFRASDVNEAFHIATRDAASI